MIVISGKCSMDYSDWEMHKVNLLYSPRDKGRILICRKNQDT